MEQWHYNKIKLDNKNKLAKDFVLALHKAGVPISRIDTNDWDYSIPTVYVNKKKGYRQFREYMRFSNFDLKNALKHYRS
jgi:hypothetical protein